MLFFVLEKFMRRIRAEPKGSFYFIQNCAGAIARKEKRWKQSFQPVSVRRLH